MEENLDVSTLSLVKCAAHIKKKRALLNFSLLALKHISCVIGLSLTSANLCLYLAEAQESS